MLWSRHYNIVIEDPELAGATAGNAGYRFEDWANEHMRLGGYT